MKIPMEIAEKVRRHQRASKEAKKLFEEVVAWLNENTDAEAVYITEIFITDEPSGTLQNGDEYCDQWQGFLEDDYSGNYFHHIEGSNEYVGYSYET